MRRTLTALGAAIVLATLFTGCKASRTSMTLPPNTDAEIRIVGFRPRIQIDSKNDRPFWIEIDRAGSQPVERKLTGYVRGRFRGTTDFTFINESDQQVEVEIKARRYRRLKILKSPAPDAAASTPSAEQPE
jgi:hypothetical protein